MYDNAGGAHCGPSDLWEDQKTTAWKCQTYVCSAISAISMIRSAKLDEVDTASRSVDHITYRGISLPSLLNLPEPDPRDSVPPLIVVLVIVTPVQLTLFIPRASLLIRLPYTCHICLSRPISPHTYFSPRSNQCSIRTTARTLPT
jgi:hypothetical protein